MLQTEHVFACPYCWQEISMIFDLSVEAQSYIEDCEVCCNPIRIYYAVEDVQIVHFDAQSIEQ